MWLNPAWSSRTLVWNQAHLQQILRQYQTHSTGRTAL